MCPSQVQERLYELKRSLKVTVSVAILTLFDFNLSFFVLLLNVENTVASQNNCAPPPPALELHCFPSFFVLLLSMLVCVRCLLHQVRGVLWRA